MPPDAPHADPGLPRRPDGPVRPVPPGAAPDAEPDVPGTEARPAGPAPEAFDPALVESRWTGLPPLATPFLSSLNRLSPRETLRPEQLADRAAACLIAAQDAAAVTATAAPVATGTAYAAVAVMAEHTRYVDGFALHLPLRQSAAAAVVPAAAPRIAGEAEDSDAHRLLVAVADALGAGPHAAAIETTVPALLRDVRAVALAVAFARALAPAEPPERHVAAARRATEAVLGLPVSLSDAAAAADAVPGRLMLSDASSGETLALDLPLGLAWGLVPTGEARSALRIAALARRADRAREHVAEALRPVASLREVEHEELAALLDAALPRHRPTLAYLVGENRRVQRFVGALRAGDAQMMGAILAISARARDEWALLSRAERAALDALDAHTGEGVLGAADVGNARAILVLARPAALAAALAAAADALGADREDALAV